MTDDKLIKYYRQLRNLNYIPQPESALIQPKRTNQIQKQYNNIDEMNKVILFYPLFFFKIKKYDFNYSFFIGPFWRQMFRRRHFGAAV